MAIFMASLRSLTKRAAAHISDFFRKERLSRAFNRNIKEVLLTPKNAKSVLVASLTIFLAVGAVFIGGNPLKKKQFSQGDISPVKAVDNSADGQVPDVEPKQGETTIRSNLPKGGNEVSRGWISRSDRFLLARVIEGEASGESLEGKVAVGAVIVNRMENENFPKDIRGVVYQPLAFEAVSNGIYTRPVSSESLRAADLAISGQDPTRGAIYYWNPVTAKSKWVWQRPIVKFIGGHVFAK